MAIVRFAQPFDAVHGTIAGVAGDTKVTIYTTRKSSGVARQWVDPANPQSTNQMVIRGYQTAAATAYSALTKAQAALWIAAAEQVHRENILNLTYELSGINLFTMINSYRQIDGQSILSDVPPIEQPTIPVSATNASKPNPTTLAFLGNIPGAPAGQLLLARVSAPLPSAVRKARKNDVSIIGSWPEAIVGHTAGAATFLLTVASGDYVAGDRIGVELTPLSQDYFPGTKFLETNIGIS